VYKTLNHIQLSQKNQLAREQTSYLISAWILFLAFSSLKCSCSGTLGCIWNLLVQVGLILGLLNAKTFNKKIFEENTVETIIGYGRSLVEKYLPKKKAD